MSMKTIPAKIPAQQEIKALHLKAIYLYILRNQGTSRAQLTKALQLSFPSISALVDELLEKGFIREEGTAVSQGRGRPRSMLHCNGSSFCVPVFTLVREGFRVCHFDGCGVFLEETLLPIADVPKDPDQLWTPSEETLCAPLLEHLCKLQKSITLLGAVLCVPGSINARGILTSSALHLAAPANFLSRLENRFQIQMALINISDAEAYAEKFFQPLSEDFAFIHIGAGVGAGIIRNGEIILNSSLRSGELGHISIDYNGPVCSCGNRGCLERYISLRQIETEGQLLGFANLEVLAKAYTQGQEKAVALLEEKAHLLAIGISNMLTMQPVNHVVLGGGICQFGNAFLEAVRKAVSKLGFRKYMNMLTVTYTQNATGDGSIGAFWHYLDSKWILE